MAELVASLVQGTESLGQLQGGKGDVGRDIRGKGRTKNICPLLCQR